MKKIFCVLVMALSWVALYNYQKPILSTEEAIVQAYEHLKNPSSKTEMSLPPIQIELDAIPEEDISLRLHQQSGFLNQLFNHQQWEVLIRYEDVIPTLVMDANTGELLDIIGPMN